MNCFLQEIAESDPTSQCKNEELVALLGKSGRKPVTYAGGASSLEDLERVDQISDGAVDLTIGSALDIFGGDGVNYSDCVIFNQLPVSL